jgi:hypothetical protein
MFDKVVSCLFASSPQQALSMAGLMQNGVFRVGWDHELWRVEKDKYAAGSNQVLSLVSAIECVVRCATIKSTVAVAAETRGIHPSV